MEYMETEKTQVQGTGKTKQLVLTALLFAMALVLSIVEGFLPPVPVPVPGVKYGLSNIAVMYALFFLSKSQAYTIAVLKSVFVLATRGLTAGALSFCGGILSVSVMALLMVLFNRKITYLMLSIAGAVAHNTGQFIAITLIYTGMNMIAYLPILLVSGIVAGTVTAMLLKFILPVFKKLDLNNKTF